MENYGLGFQKFTLTVSILAFVLSAYMFFLDPQTIENRKNKRDKTNHQTNDSIYICPSVAKDTVYFPEAFHSEPNPE